MSSSQELLIVAARTEIVASHATALTRFGEWTDEDCKDEKVPNKGSQLLRREKEKKRRKEVTGSSR